MSIQRQKRSKDKSGALETLEEMYSTWMAELPRPGLSRVVTIEYDTQRNSLPSTTLVAIIGKGSLVNKLLTVRYLESPAFTHN